MCVVYYSVIVTVGFINVPLNLGLLEVILETIRVCNDMWYVPECYRLESTKQYDTECAFYRLSLLGYFTKECTLLNFNKQQESDLSQCISARTCCIFCYFSFLFSCLCLCTTCMI